MSVPREQSGTSGAAAPVTTPPGLESPLANGLDHRPAVELGSTLWDPAAGGSRRRGETPRAGTCPSIPTGLMMHQDDGRWIPEFIGPLARWPATPFQMTRTAQNGWSGSSVRVTRVTRTRTISPQARPLLADHLRLNDLDASMDSRGQDRCFRMARCQRAAPSLGHQVEALTVVGRPPSAGLPSGGRGT